MLEAYRKHADSRAALGIPALPLTAQQTSELCELLKNPPDAEKEELLALLRDRVPPGVDDAAYVKAGFLTTITEFKVPAETKTDDLSPALHATTRPDIPLHAWIMLESKMPDGVPKSPFFYLYG